MSDLLRFPLERRSGHQPGHSVVDRIESIWQRAKRHVLEGQIGCQQLEVALVNETDFAFLSCAAAKPFSPNGTRSHSPPS